MFMSYRSYRYIYDIKCYISYIYIIYVYYDIIYHISIRTNIETIASSPQLHVIDDRF